jgi:hypothetical protein
MKLYANTTSERASKGQGGNREIVIELTIDEKERKMIGRVVMRYEEDAGYTVYYYPITETTGKGGRILLHEEKGKKLQKAKCLMQDCNRDATQDSGYCHSCEKTQ